MSIKPVILADGIVTANPGPSVGLRGERIGLSAGAQKGRYDFPIEVFTIASGTAASTATVLIEVSSGNRAIITAVTAANPASVTAAAHGFATGDKVTISTVVGMTQLNGNTYTITVVDANTFTLGVDSSAYTAYSSAGVAMGAWVTWGSLSFTIPASGQAVPLNRVGKLTGAYDYIRIRPTAISGCTIQGYVKRMDA